MRSLELALLVCEVLAIAAMAGRGRRLFFALSLVAAVIAVAQAGVEGVRWQMFPGYGLAAILLCLSAGHLMRRTGPWASWVRLAVTGSLAGWALIASVLPWFLPVFVFPAVDGPFGIGTQIFHWVDSGRHELFSSDPAARRELMVQIWYPAPPAPGAPTDPYVHGVDFSGVTADLAHLPPFLLDHLGFVRTEAVAMAPAAEGRLRVGAGFAPTISTRSGPWSRMATLWSGSIIPSPSLTRSFPMAGTCGSTPG
jgi:hypothetical protein